MLGVFAESRKLCEQKGDAGTLEAGWTAMPTCWAFSPSPESCVNRKVMLGLSKLGGPSSCCRVFLTAVSAVDTVFVTVLPTTVEKADYTSYSA